MTVKVDLHGAVSLSGSEGIVTHLALDAARPAATAAGAHRLRAELVQEFAESYLSTAFPEWISSVPTVLIPKTDFTFLPALARARFHQPGPPVLICIKLNDVLAYPQGGGHGWVFYNWALGFEALGHEVVLMDDLPAGSDALTSLRLTEAFAVNAAEAGLRAKVSVLPFKGSECALPTGENIVLWQEVASRADLLVNFQYTLDAEVVSMFRRTCLVDIDPGLTQIWIDQGLLRLAPHDIYFTTGETVGALGSSVPHCGIHWRYTPPAVHLAAWAMTAMPSDANFTTVSNWWGEWLRLGDDEFDNSKAAGFSQFLDLPSFTPSQLEVALSLVDDSQGVRPMLETKGWIVSDAWDRVPTPAKYRAFIRASRGEFSCAKPSCVRLHNAWVSDRTLCYLASGRPAVVQYTGRSDFLPDRAGLLRFRTLAEAVDMLRTVNADPVGQGQLARRLAEEHFDSERICRNLLERAI